MSKDKVQEFLTENPGYIKKGSATLIDILKAKQIDISNLTQQDIKDILRLNARGYGKRNKNKVQRPLKILTYDIETTLVEAFLWNSGKQYVGHNNITTETQIMTVAYKWIGSPKVEYIKWNMKKRNDKKLIKKFVEEYNKADMVIGWNNNSFDNKIINSRAMKYGLDVNTHVKSFDIMRQIKKQFRLPSYSMAYVAKYLGLAGKLNYGGGLDMWKDIQWGSKQDAKRAMKVMVAYNVQDVALTEEIFFKIRKYLGHVIHVGALQGKSKATCPSCGNNKLKHYKTIATAAGTLQHVMKCKNDKTKFKISHTEYLKTL